jgi:hypothetical protein
MAGPPPRTRPQRRVTDHYHPEYWTEVDHNRFEDRVSKEIHDLRAEVRGLGQRMAWLLGGLGAIIFVVNIVATWIIRTAI